MSRFFVCLWIFAVLIFACSKSSTSFDDAGPGGRDSSFDALSSSTSSSSGSDALADVPPVDAPFAVASAAVDASFSGDACDERLALKFGTISPPQLLPNRDPNGDGGDQVTVVCTLDSASGKYSLTLGVASGVSLVVKGGGGGSTSATLSNATTTYAAASCATSNADISGDHVIVTLTCASTTVGGASSGSPTPSPCELDAQLDVAGCTGP